MLNSKSLKTFDHVQHAEATQMVMDLITDPEASHKREAAPISKSSVAPLTQKPESRIGHTTPSAT